MYFKYLSAAFGMITSVYSASTTGRRERRHWRSSLRSGTSSTVLAFDGHRRQRDFFSTKRGSEKCDRSENQYFTSAVIGAVILSILAWIGAICFERPILTFFRSG